MPEPAPQVTDDAIPGALSVAYWVVATLLYAGLGSQLPQAAFLGFWQCIPFLLLAHWLRPRVLGFFVRPWFVGALERVRGRQ
ncbi:MAG: hypothetical protein U0Y82_03910 [Thermoleophilia bacterium]